MCHAFLNDSNFYHLLFQIDQFLADDVQRAGCPSCGGVLHTAPYPRKPINEDGSIDENGNRIPDELLEQQFGPDVHQALATLQAEMAKTKAGGQSDLMDILIAYQWKDMFSEFTVDPVDIEQEVNG